MTISATAERTLPTTSLSRKWKKPADRKELVGSEDFALFCWDSVNHLPAIRRISLKASLTSRLIDFKYLREAEAPAYTHGVSNDIFDYEFDDDDDDIPAFSFPEA